jgi:hypothetical protein
VDPHATPGESRTSSPEAQPRPGRPRGRKTPPEAEGAQPRPSVKEITQTVAEVLAEAKAKGVETTPQPSQENYVKKTFWNKTRNPRASSPTPTPSPRPHSL